MLVQHINFSERKSSSSQTEAAYFMILYEKNTLVLIQEEKNIKI